MDLYTANIYGLPIGAYVHEVVTGSCAEKAGMKAGDIITQLGDTAVESYTDLVAALKNFGAGDTTNVTVYRAGEYLEMTITFDERPQTTQVQE